MRESWRNELIFRHFLISICRDANSRVSAFPRSISTSPFRDPPEHPSPCPPVPLPLAFPFLTYSPALYVSVSYAVLMVIMSRPLPFNITYQHLLLLVVPLVPSTTSTLTIIVISHALHALVNLSIVCITLYFQFILLMSPTTSHAQSYTGKLHSVYGPQPRQVLTFLT